MHADVQDQLRHAERVCPFRYLRTHSIFDDEMMVDDEDEAHLRHTEENKRNLCAEERNNRAGFC
ncbi:hypothetical protein J27TS7_14620 [Paenibacillus dendritiformis]|nr:hypothetical protein J27TS7_14620 [Paenibacillus dendritiformis]